MEQKVQLMQDAANKQKEKIELMRKSTNAMAAEHEAKLTVSCSNARHACGHS
jgi:hypothetical protein